MKVGGLNSNSRPQDRANVVLFYASTPPAHVFNQVARQLAQERYHSLSENARVLAVLNMAISDSLVASFYNKYHYVFWRPETAIHGGDTDHNAKTIEDSSFLPFIPTPCFPSYPSNNGSGSNALLRRGGKPDHVVESWNSQHRAAVHIAQADYQRHLRCSRLRRIPFPLRSGWRSGSRKDHRHGGLQEQLASCAR